MLEPMLPAVKTAGRPWTDHRGALEGMVWKYRTGAPWRDVPERFGKWNSIYKRFNRWAGDGTWEALLSGQADLAIGVGTHATPPAGIEFALLGDIDFVFAVAPHHPLANHQGPISDAELLRHRAVAVADSAQRMTPITVNLLPGQDVLTVASTQAKIEAQIRCMGCGYIPEPMARPHVEAGRLVVKEVERARPRAHMGYAWRSGTGGRGKRQPLGLALQWWLGQLESPATKRALLERHSGPWGG